MPPDALPVNIPDLIAALKAALWRTRFGRSIRDDGKTLGDRLVVVPLPDGGRRIELTLGPGEYEGELPPPTPYTGPGPDVGRFFRKKGE